MLHPALRLTIGAVLLAALGGIVAISYFGRFFGPARTLVETLPSTSLGLTARSLNGRIQPRGRPTTYWFELGETTAYGRTTKPVSLPPRIGAYYRESWDEHGRAGWFGGLGSGDELVHEGSGGVTGGHVSWNLGTETAPANQDDNHNDGIGTVKLAQYVFTGPVPLGPPDLSLGGGDPDFRGARVSVSVRGDRGLTLGPAELVFWLQSTPNVADLGTDRERFSNWAYTRSRLTGGLLSSRWERVSYVLDNDTNAWTYAGNNVNEDREDYIYVPLDQVLGHLNGDLFHMVVMFEAGTPPYGPSPGGGRLRFDEIEIAYRNESALMASNGGRLRSGPAGGGPLERLTDGWRTGVNRTWRSAPWPTAPLDFTYELADPVEIDTIQIHQGDPDCPSERVEVHTGYKGSALAPLVSGVIPEKSAAGPSFTYFLNRLPAPVMADVVRVRVSSGYRKEAWCLGEIEVFGQDAVVETDNDWYGVTADFDGLEAGKEYHWRLWAESGGVKVKTDDATFTVPETTAPELRTLGVTRLGNGSATFEGRLNPLGVPTNYCFEYGVDPPRWEDPTYAQKTLLRYGGRQLTPRTVTDVVTGLVPGTTYHVRMVGELQTGVEIACGDSNPVKERTSVSFVAR
ncbi:MAG TPA: hypothetical protein VF017_05360 [Thermoanaerobaculia bacterium]|nr:hypothetical protein [Thermoanaerobaculia bacterium]